jgi:polyisoprenoid-binding protein YceI
MKLARLALLAAPMALALSLAACEDPAANKPKAVVSSATPVSTGAAAPSQAAGPREAMQLDSAGSSVGFVGSKVTGKHEGKFQKVFGSVELVGGKIEGGKLIVDVELGSVKTDQEKLDGHLQNSDFFDAAKFIKSTFTSTEIKPGGEGGATHTITGQLDLHGMKQTITFPAKITITADAVSGTAEFSINRKNFGIAYAGKADDLIRDDVLLKIDLKAARKK